MESQKSPARTVKTTDTVFDIIEIINELDGARVTDVVDELGLAKSTVSDHLSTLHKRGYLVHKDGMYQLGLRFLQHGIQARNYLQVRDAAQTPLEDLATETGECAWLVVEEHQEAVFIDKKPGEKAVPTMGKIGRRTLMHTSAAGKAILAHLPADHVETLIDEQGLPAQTEHTITDRDELYERLESVRNSGIAFNNQETNKGVRAVSSPILCDGEVQGALAIAGPSSRLKNDTVIEQITDELENAANIVELNIKHGQV
jgi:DNA-binding IclR family transcriptional regulator